MTEQNKPKTILLLEDDSALNRAIVLKLEQRGHNVVSTTLAEDAFKVLEEKHNGIDIIWLDILLPGMNGIEFLKEIRKNPEYKDIRVVICSVSGQDESKMIARELGASDYLIKSDYDLESLIGKVLSYAK